VQSDGATLYGAEEAGGFSMAGLGETNLFDAVLSRYRFRGMTPPKAISDAQKIARCFYSPSRWGDPALLPADGLHDRRATAV